MTSLSVAQPIETQLRRFELFLRCHRGRMIAGQGDHAIGDLLPGWFSQLGLTDIKAHQNDRPAAMYPPYTTPAQQAVLANPSTRSIPWSRAEMLNHFVLGGGRQEDFDRAFHETVEAHVRECEAIAAKSFHAGYGGVSYLVSGRRPRPA